MSNKHHVHNLIILDESGSMHGIKDNIIKGFNEIVQTIKGIESGYQEQEHFISLVSFNGLGHKILHYMDPVSKLNEIDANRYQPNASTPLYDAMGFSFGKLRQILQNVSEYNVLVTILTDGAENASKEFTGPAIKTLIEELKQKKWTFTYIGADHDVEKFARSISIENTLTWQKTEAGMTEMFQKEHTARKMYSEKIRNKEETNSGYFTK